MARSILVFSAVISIVVCALNSGEAQPPSLDGLPDDLDNALIATPPSAQAPILAPTLAPPASSSDGAHPFNGTLVIGPPDTPRVRPTVPSGAPAAYSGYGPDREQSLRQQYLKLAERRAERMDATELQRGIADMRRAFLIAELKAFADESPDEFDATR